MAAPSENLERIVAKMRQTERSCEQMLDEDHQKNEDFVNTTLQRLKRKHEECSKTAVPVQLVSKRAKTVPQAIPVVVPAAAVAAPAAVTQDEQDFSQYTYAQIRTMCKEQGLPGKGKREVLEERLAHHFRLAQPAVAANDVATADLIADVLHTSQEEQARLQREIAARKAAEEEEQQKRALAAREEEHRAEQARLLAQQRALEEEEARAKQQAEALERAQREAAALEQTLREEAEALEREQQKRDADAAAAAAEEARLAELNRQMREKATASELLKKLVVAPAQKSSNTSSTTTPGRVFSGGAGGNAANTTANSSSNTSMNKSANMSGNSTSLFKPFNFKLNTSSSTGNTSSFLQDKSLLKPLSNNNNGGGGSSTGGGGTGAKPTLFGLPPTRVPAAAAPPQPEPPAPVPAAHQEPFRFTDDENSSDDEDEEEDGNQENASLQKVPDWAKGDGLKQALKLQYERYHDLDEIFPENRNPAEFPLEEIFKKKTGIRPRSSSAIWTQDAVTTEQKLEYHQTAIKPPGSSSKKY